MKITLEHYKNTYSAVIPDDVDVEQIMYTVTGLVIAIGYHPELLIPYAEAQENYNADRDTKL